MKSGVSEITGRAVFGDGSVGVAYSALRPLVCASCGGSIAAGQIFTRDCPPGRSLRLWPRCRACLPFTLEGAGSVRSPLLESLLKQTEQAQAPAPNAEAKRDAGERRRVEEAVRERLGPALRKARRKRLG